MARGKRSATKKTSNDTGARLGFEQTLWAAADKLRGHMDASEYKHVVLGLIFLKYISDAFQERYEKLKALPPEECADPEDRDECCAPDLIRIMDGLQRRCQVTVSAISGTKNHGSVVFPSLVLLDSRDPRPRRSSLLDHLPQWQSDPSPV